ncbi:phosphate ABC transporter substrate-binding protein [Fundidesulfovibrio soli]|uniref:phosphate ABC transporter substrate-binding protein n=1 Tax=Fundidesulfovibrio soli TaxID=2922716 RepID=UPI001FB04447|nr:phosphate ABC transporter substrate-binding protein [Fundidesulfovibrio soli]
MLQHSSWREALPGLRRGLALIALAAALVLPAAIQALAAGGSQSVHVAGSNTLRLFTQLSAEQYMRENPGTIVTVAGGGTARGVKALIDGTAEVALISSEIPEELERKAKAEKIHLKTIPLSSDAVVPVVNPQNPVSALTMDQLKKIYSGKITNWKDVGGDNAPIVVTTHDGVSGTYELWKDKVLGTDAAITPQAKTLEMQPMLRAVAADRNAIGYVAWSLLNDNVKALTVDGFAADRETILNGGYPLMRVLAVVVRENPSEGTQAFVRFLQAPGKGQELAKQLRMLPISTNPAQ